MTIQWTEYDLDYWRRAARNPRFMLSWFFAPPHVRQWIGERIEHEGAECDARALGIESEAKALWHERCAAAHGSPTLRPPTLRQIVQEIVHEIVARDAPSGGIRAAARCHRG